ncbi:Rne/Rng family ribonuclease [Desulforhopalus singaporensis]|uniref:Ribonuclease G n=1 Tax=Desulforhopalus singaporensis TaxID=91360 RepID=A0A1H0NAC0_9BACT|nr:Rne/Rng family ribonuclease [Desulforhopalus singaporensis]SDO89669.1 RNAse E [Desulforhopalus singaporensis]
MVQTNKNAKDKKIVKIKATTGAWWKSTSKLEVPQEEPKDNALPATAVAQQQEAPEKKSRKQVKTGSAPKRPRKKSPATGKNEVEADAAGQELSADGSEPVKKEPAKAKRGRTRKKAAADQGSTKESAASTPEEKAPAAGVGKKSNRGKGEAGQSEGPGVEAEVKEKPKPKRARPRKKGGGAETTQGKKGRTADKQQKEAVSAVPEQQEVAAQETAVKAGKAEKSGEVTPDAGAKEDAPAEKEAAAKKEAVSKQREQTVSAEAEVDSRPDKTQEEAETSKLCKLLINAEEPEECRLALLEDGKLESIHISTASSTQRKNNIYKARIVALEPSLQAAFVDYGAEKNGFLPFNEIHPEYYRQDLSKELRHLVDTHQWKKLSITDVMEKGQEILAQVVKEEVGKKGANMTTYLSIPGRCVVLMPGSDSAGISRKISGEKRRVQLRETMKSMDIPEGIGWIVRTASVDITQTALEKDVKFLLKLWKDIKNSGQTLDGVGLVYKDQDSVLRFLREHFDPSIEEILVDDVTAFEQVKSFIEMLPKSQQDVKVRLYKGARPIFNQYSVEDQIESIYQPQVNLPSGGSIVIDPTEALVAIDVNSGSTSKGKNFEESIFQANLEAATELARQLRLRDLGGLVVVDFIDMRSRKNILAVEKQVKMAMKKDKAKVDFSRISKFGLMQISRQKLGAPIEAGNYQRCEHCKGRGTVRSVETLSLFYLRRIQTGASRKPVERIECHFPLEVASYLLNKKRTELSDMEKSYGVEIAINARSRMKPADNEIIFHKKEKEPTAKKRA